MTRTRSEPKARTRALDALWSAYWARAESRYVRASPVDADSWAGPYVFDGVPYFALDLRPPCPGWPCWSVVAHGNDDTAYFRRNLTEEKARALYGRINPQTQIRTLRNNHGFRAE